MNLYEVTKEILEDRLALPKGTVPDEFVIVAKHLVMGLAPEQVADTLGVTSEVLDEVQADPLFQQIKGFIGAVYAESQVDQAAGWDALENTAINTLMKRMQYQKDPEFLLRVAAVANRAQRRTKATDNVLDPGRVGHTTITLSSRLVRKINESSAGRETIEAHEKVLSIRDGSMTNPAFADVDRLLSVKTHATTYMPEADVRRQANDDPTPEQIVNDFLQSEARKR